MSIVGINNLPPEILANITEQIQLQIDQYIIEDAMRDSLQHLGWTSCPIKNQYSDEVSAWIHINAKGDYKMLHGQWWFELSADAMLFTLRWA